MSKKKLIRVVASIVGGYHYLTNNTDNNQANTKNNQSANSSRANAPSIKNQAQVFTKIRTQRDNTHARFWLETEGNVIKLLKDDTKGNPHQKFLIKLAPDITLLVAHNIALAKRVPIQQGDTIKIRARYEWNNRGGVLHWTHHDPKGKQQGGWIYADGAYYK
jgi:hypothetical protein